MSEKVNRIENAAAAESVEKLEILHLLVINNISIGSNDGVSYRGSSLEMTNSLFTSS